MPFSGRDEMEQIQLERLQSTLNRAFRNVPFHQKRLQEQGIDPARVETLGDIDGLPFTRRQHLGEFYPYGLFAVPLRDIVRIHTSPGAGLNPSVSGYTCQDLDRWRSMVARTLAVAGVTPNDILQISLAPGLANWGRDYKDGAEKLEASVIPNTALSIEKQLMVLRDYKTTVLITTPSFARQIARRAVASGIPATSFNLKTLILVGEPASVSLREQLEAQLQVTTWVQYGLSEVPGPAMAFECEAHDGLHIHEEHFLAEIVDPESGNPLPAGDAGELILTTLTTRAFPLIRFRTGDRARIIETACPCGLADRRIEWYADRIDDMIYLRGVKIDRGQVRRQVEQALGFAPRITEISIHNPDNGEVLQVAIAVEDALFSDEIKMLEKLMQSVADSIRENLGVPVTVKLKEERSM